MFSGPMIVLLLVVSILPASGLNSTASPNATTLAVTTTTASGLNTTLSPDATTLAVTTTTASGLNSTASPNATTPAVNTTTVPTDGSTVKPTSRPSEKLPTDGSTVKTTSKPSEKTCAKIGVKVNRTWTDEFENKSSYSYKIATELFSNALTMLYNDSGKYDDVEVSEVKSIKKDNKVGMAAKLCLVFKGNDDDFIEDVFTKKVNSGELSQDLSVIKGSAEFEAVGVTFKDWKAKEGECKECDGAAGPFDIVGTCVVKTQGFSCKGLKTTKKSEDCVEYCSSSPAAITVSSLIFAMGIFVSFSFNFSKC